MIATVTYNKCCSARKLADPYCPQSGGLCFLCLHSSCFLEQDPHLPQVYGVAFLTKDCNFFKFVLFFVFCYSWSKDVMPALQQWCFNHKDA